jgi:hypothetical protein
MSTINYTYNVIVDRFRQFAAGHFQLRRFTHGEISQADLEKEAEWPWLHVKPRAINYSPGTRSFSFEIFISDLPRDKEDKTGYQAESITDCSLIFQDLINEIYLGNMFGDQVVLSRPVNSEPFVEQYTHTLTGVTGIVELNLDYDWSACSIPASWNYNTPTDSPSDGWGALQFIESLDQNGVFVSLLNDVEAPGNSYYYGTNAEGVKGWFVLPSGNTFDCEDLLGCTVFTDLQTEVSGKANIDDISPVGLTNDYNDLDNLPTIPAAQVNADWNAVSGVAEILNKPTLTNGTVTSVGITAGTGISVSGSPVTSSGSITVTNSAPDQTVSLTAGTNIGVSGTYPNFTINNTQSLAGLVADTRTITINGTSQDLSADRSYTIDKASVGLSNVDNTSDLNKPISTATQTALDAKQDTLTLTTTGTSGAATLVGATLNVPQYTASSSTVYVFNMNGYKVPNSSLFYGVYLGGTPVNPTVVTTQYGGAATTFFPGYPMPTGTASNLVVILRAAQVAPTSTVTLKLTNTSTSTFGPVVTIAAGSAAGTYTDNSATVSFATNERLTIVASNPFVAGATAGPQLSTGSFKYTT